MSLGFYPKKKGSQESRIEYTIGTHNPQPIYWGFKTFIFHGLGVQGYAAEPHPADLMSPVSDFWRVELKNPVKCRHFEHRDLPSGIDLF